VASWPENKVKFTILNTKKDSIYNLFRNLGYHFVSERLGEYNFSRPVSGSAFPRFDIYLTLEDDNIIINLHLDQKGPMYRGITAHSGEYDGPLLDKEAQRIKETINYTF
jgi:hypothetical protein